MRRPIFTEEELEEIRRADKEINREIALERGRTGKHYKPATTQELLEKKRAYDRAYRAARKARMTPEEREKQRAYRRAYSAAYRANMSPEQREKKRAYDRARAKVRWANMTPEQREQNRIASRARMAARRERQKTNI